MLNATFDCIFNTTALTLGNVLTSILSALAMGIVIALCFRFRNNVSHSFLTTLATLPPIVAVIIIMVDGNLGTGVAVAGTFSLVRFRSLPGTAREISGVMLAMAVGLSCGIGYPLIGFILTIVLCLVYLLLSQLNFGKRNTETQKTLRITVPEDLDYSDKFQDIFVAYTNSAKLISVKTTNLGSLNKLTYAITLKNPDTEKAMIDQLRCRNGNLEISISTAECSDIAL